MLLIIVYVWELLWPLPMLMKAYFLYTYFFRPSIHPSKCKCIRVTLECQLFSLNFILNLVFFLSICFILFHSIHSIMCRYFANAVAWITRALAFPRKFLKFSVKISSLHKINARAFACSMELYFRRYSLTDSRSSFSLDVLFLFGWLVLLFKQKKNEAINRKYRQIKRAANGLANVCIF